MNTSRRLTGLVLIVVAALLPAPPASAATYERLANGSFDSAAKQPWWSSANTPSTVDAGRLCADVPGGTGKAWDALIGQSNIPFENGQSYKLTFKASASKNVRIRPVAQMDTTPFTAVLSGWASVTSSPATFEYTGTSTIEHATGQLLFQVGGASEPYRLCLDDISLTGGTRPPRGGRDLGSPVRVNQVGYLLDGPKRATIVTTATQPLTWTLSHAGGAVEISGQTTVSGADALSGDNVHLADFSAVRAPGTYELSVGAERSVPFEITADLYGKLRTDAAAYFYHNRSGIPISSDYVPAAYARPAGHAADAPNGDGAQWGGWYDAGDHGKYVVNGALAAWQLIDSYEQSGSPVLRIPEAAGVLPDILDEAKWELDFLLRMQRSDGLVHHKIHDVEGTGLPMPPQDDPKPRKLFDPTTAATLNLAAVGARCARVYQQFDSAFAGKCLSAAKLAWEAARANPKLLPAASTPGGGAYFDDNVSDEFSWAAAELYAATGLDSYKSEATASLDAGNFSWKKTGGLGDIALIRVPNPLYDRARAHIIAAAEQHLKDMHAQGYPNPDRPTKNINGVETPWYYWGSTSGTTNKAMVMGLAHTLTGDSKFRDGALEALDYLFGRNALNQSYVTGYGERASMNQHHRFWAHQLRSTLPNPPPGALAGGPNSDVSVADPAKLHESERFLSKCAPAKCYVDHIGSYLTNEVAINWNSALVWMSAFAAG
ncbi:glycoside hydrolase family 9 protein [Nocardia yamanashiensis]|uniref:glycoside hydrolase family 9 protein n=1 Tax=Nocardia yamanashiensis TaxID=209247 RepID=UPI0014713002|nr:glycoside hydrolase family 9 protein [Nocardia yamanashiensis]